MTYYGNSTVGFEADDECSLYLQCPSCNREIVIVGDPSIFDSVKNDRYVLSTHEAFDCKCGRRFDEGDELTVDLPETPTPVSDETDLPF